MNTNITLRRKSGRERQRRYLASHPERGRDAVRRYAMAHPERIREKDKRADPAKVRARQILNKAIRAGKIVRGICWCGKPGEAHHTDYSKPLEVVWLCRTHHAREHRTASC